MRPEFFIYDFKINCMGMFSFSFKDLYTLLLHTIALMHHVSV